ncbi:hypothetical protein [uncultured Salegentibacter sp.]|uniref:hypothetical protein n=1 Tax=uncultured Salegentibacter sp. TaxID=259320 RepID=UPI0025993917|nr:hypothetical protein [uncultured Salegentibacter sp.]
MVKLELLGQFKEEFKDAINPDLISLKMVQTEDDVFLEKLYRYNENLPVKESLSGFTQPVYQKINELKFERSGEIPQFLPDTDIEENAWILISEYDRHSMVMLLDDIFTEEGALEILNNL